MGTQVTTKNTSDVSQLTHFHLSFEYDRTLQEIKRDVKMRTDR